MSQKYTFLNFLGQQFPIGASDSSIQNGFLTISADTGSTSADQATDVLNIVGGNGIATEITGDTIEIRVVGGGSMDGISEVMADTSPVLGGELDTNGERIFNSVNNSDLVVDTTGTGRVQLTGLKYPNVDGNAMQYMTTDGSGNLSFADMNFGDNMLYVSTQGSDTDGNGSLNRPYASISVAMAAITDASPTKRYIINLSPGRYNESTVSLKANVFIVGKEKISTRIIAAGFEMGAGWSGGDDHRSGISNCILEGASDYDWAAVTSSAGKLYFDNCSFSSSVSFTGYNNAIAQIGTSNCLFFGTWTISGINAGIHKDNIHYNDIFLNQHPTLPTILNANGGGAGSTTLTTTVDNFNRRCSGFFYSFWAGSLTIDGPQSYVDATQSSLDTAGPQLVNGGRFIPIGSTSSVNSTLSNLSNPTSINANLVPDNSNSRYSGDFGKQWLFNFAYVYGSTGTDMYLVTVPETFGNTDTGRSIYIQPDGYGINADVNGGDIILQTASTSGTGVRGEVTIDARQVSMSNALIKNLGSPVSQSDAATAGYADVFPSGLTGARPPSPVIGQRFFDTSLGKPIWYDGSQWVDALGALV